MKTGSALVAPVGEATTTTTTTTEVLPVTITDTFDRSTAPGDPSWGRFPGMTYKTVSMGLPSSGDGSIVTNTWLPPSSFAFAGASVYDGMGHLDSTVWEASGGGQPASQGVWVDPPLGYPVDVVVRDMLVLHGLGDPTLTTFVAGRNFYLWQFYLCSLWGVNNVGVTPWIAFYAEASGGHLWLGIARYSGSSFSFNGGSADLGPISDWIDVPLNAHIRADESGCHMNIWKAATTGVTDTFTRTVSNGWGTSDYGTTWSNYTMPEYQWVDGSTGKMQINETASYIVGARFPHSGPVNVTWKMTLNRDPIHLSEFSFSGEIIWLYTHPSVYIEVGTLFSGQKYVYLDLNGTAVWGYHSVDYTQQFHVRLTDDGSTVTATIWQSGAAEPASPTCSATGWSHTPSNVTMGMERTDWPSATALIATIDDFDVVGASSGSGETGIEPAGWMCEATFASGGMSDFMLPPDGDGDPRWLTTFVIDHETTYSVSAPGGLNFIPTGTIHVGSVEITSQQTTTVTETITTPGVGLGPAATGKVG